MGPDYVALVPLYKALDDHATQPVSILQIGDSHTANDAFSGRMRSLFQQRFGGAGRGMLPPGVPFKFYHPAQVSVAASGWHVVSSLSPSSTGRFGISGLRQTATGPAEMILRADEPDGFDEVTIEALGRPGGGTLYVTPEDGIEVPLATGVESDAPLWLTVPIAPGHPSVALRTRGDGPVDVLSWTATRHRPGVTYSNMGTISATIDLAGRWDPALVSAELARLQPKLILIAFGTNEGFRDSTDPVAYQARYAERVRAIHAAAPGAAILVMGPPDGNRRSTDAAAATCPAAVGEPSDPTAWTVPPRLAEVREAQRQVARADGYYFWDWSAAMGGPCSMRDWAKTSPPMGAADHVHLLTPGYRATADKLFAEIMQGYEQYRNGALPR